MSYIYQDKARWDWWFKVVLILPLVIIAFAFFSDFKMGEVARYVVIAVVVVLGFIFWLVMPRRFFIMEDRIRFVQGLGISFSVPYDRVEIVRELSKSSFNINLTTSNDTAIELVVNRGRNINFSPENRDEFIKKLNDTIKKWKTGSDR
jgi:hypothetical protein